MAATSAGAARDGSCEFQQFFRFMNAIQIAEHGKTVDVGRQAPFFRALRRKLVHGLLCGLVPEKVGGTPVLPTVFVVLQRTLYLLLCPALQQITLARPEARLVFAEAAAKLCTCLHEMPLAAYAASLAVPATPHHKAHHRLALSVQEASELEMPSEFFGHAGVDMVERLEMRHRTAFNLLLALAFPLAPDLAKPSHGPANERHEVTIQHAQHQILERLFAWAHKRHCSVATALAMLPGDCREPIDTDNLAAKEERSQLFVDARERRKFNNMLKKIKSAIDDMDDGPKTK